ncbi:M7GpppX diphosphatase [Elysia marginata]|uniref:m7GpppX diphosphatase n=1 Tax=Elysia marginata TaxID=1093978 RepID=A0AAV4JFF2_9GAST|nr:M7GpppX diphosphatase [Elysia marginata]
MTTTIVIDLQWSSQAGKPSNDTFHPDYIPTLKLVVTRTLPIKVRRRRARKIQETQDEAEKRNEAAKALLTMTKGNSLKQIKSPQQKQKACQTVPDAAAALSTAKINHLEKEIALLQRINHQLRSQRQIFEDELKRSRQMASTPVEIKKRKLTNESGDTTVSENLSSSVFKDFTIKRVLREDPRNKFISLHGSLTKGEHTAAEAVVLLERKPFEVSTLEESLKNSRTTETLSNDIYSTHDAFSAGLSPDLKATVICPATEKHISKYSEHEPFLVRETPDLYKTVTEPCMAQSKFSIQWVYNILEKKMESERIVVEDPDPELGFVLLPDMKWDRKNQTLQGLVCPAGETDTSSMLEISVDLKAMKGEWLDWE